MPIKAIVGGVEKEITRIPVLAHDIETATGTNSVTFNTSSDRLIECDILGNTQQNGTPAPDAPIMPDFVGEKTENLFDESAFYASITVVTQKGTFSISGGTLTVSSGNENVAYTIPFQANDGSYRLYVQPNTTYYVNFENSENSRLLMFKNGLATAAFSMVRPTTITTDSDAEFYTFRFGTVPSVTGPVTIWIKSIMLNAGSTPLPYEPYGYKIPITCAGQTTPIYLGQVQTTRKIKKLVLTGQESGWLNQYASVVFELGFEDVTILGVESVSSHYVFNPIQSSIVSGLTNGEYALKYFSSGTNIYINDQLYTTVESWKSYLAQQYSAGTPVTVWYVLAEPETGIVNEPLMKIGTYDDELHSTDAAVTIPTARGSNTLTVDTTLAPSQTTVTYRGTTTAYKDAWEVRDNQDRLVWYRNDTLTGVSSISFKGYGLPLKSETIKGQASQNGTPTPDAPVDVVGCGEKTGNIYDKTNVITLPTGDRYGVYAPFGTYSIYNDTANSVFDFVDDGASRHEVCPPKSTATVTLISGYPDKKSGFFMPYNDASLGGVTIVSGSTPPDHYIPYGYSIPLVANSTNYPVYLGEVQSTRRIKKLVLTGDENWVLHSINNYGIANFQIRVSMKDACIIGTFKALCSHFMQQQSLISQTQTEGFLISGDSPSVVFYIRRNSSDYPNTSALKTWLSAQYSAGTPVTIWYVLATPQTRIVNEPLMKIGNYADEVTVNTAIPTSVGTNTFSVNTTLAPSGCSITGHIKAIP